MQEINFTIEDAKKIKQFLNTEKDLFELHLNLNNLTEKKKSLVNDFCLKGLNDFNDTEKRILKTTLNILSKSEKGLSFYSLFPGYDIINIKKCIKLLDESQKKIIIKKFGEDLKGNINANLTAREKEIIYFSIRRKITRALEKIKIGYKIINLEDVYPYINLETLKKYIDSLYRRQREYYYERFGENLKKYYLVKDENELIRDFAKISLEKIIKDGGKKVKPFFDIFKDYKKENESEEEFKKRVKQSVFTQTKECIDIITRIYGPDLESKVVYGNVTLLERKKFTRYISGRIKEKLENKHIEKNYSKNLYSLFPPIFTPFEVSMEIANLSSQEKALLYIKYGENLGVVNKEIDEVMNRTIKSIVKKMIIDAYKRKGAYYNITIMDLKKMNNILKGKEFIYLRKRIDSNIALSVLSYIEGININNIINIVGVDPKTYLLEVRKLLDEKENLKVLK